MDKNLYTYYKNIIMMLSDPEYRGYTLETPTTDETTFLKKFSVNNHALIRCQSPLGVVYAILFSSAAEKKKSFQKEIEPLLRDSPAQLIVIGRDDVSTHITNYMGDLYAAHPGVRIEYIGHSKFVIDPFKHTLTPKHSIATAEQLEAANIFPADYQKLPRILSTDVACVYIGAIPGQVVRIERMSNTAGKIIVYRICVRAAGQKY